MIAKGKSIAHGSTAIAYGLEKNQSQEICREFLAGENVNEIQQEFEMFQNHRQSCTNNTLRFEISPAIEEGQKLNINDWEKIAKDFMRKMNLDENRQWIAVLHKDTEHHHLHIYANRIDLEGNMAKDNFISKRAGKVAEEIAQERGMITAMEVKKNKDRQLEPLKDLIKQAHHEICMIAPDQNTYIEEMKKRSIEVVLNQSNTTSTITGWSFKTEGVQIKASDIDRKMSYNKVFDVAKNTAKSITKKKEVKTTAQLLKGLNKIPMVHVPTNPLVLAFKVAKIISKAISRSVGLTL